MTKQEILKRAIAEVATPFSGTQNYRACCSSIRRSGKSTDFAKKLSEEFADFFGKDRLNIWWELDEEHIPVRQTALALFLASLS